MDADLQRWGRKPMGIEHHPSAQLISDYVTANVSPGVALAVAAHVDLCAVCGLGAAVAEGGGTRRDQKPVRDPNVTGPFGESTPDSLRDLRTGPWIAMRKGVEGALALGVSGLGESVYLLRAAPAADVGAASVKSAYLLLIVEGGLEADGRYFRAGDLAEFEQPPVSLVADARAGASVLVVAEFRPRRLAKSAP